MSTAMKAALFLFCLTACTTLAGAMEPREQRIFDYFAKAALFEFCHENAADRHCVHVNERLEVLEPEIYFFESEVKREVLVLYTIENAHPMAILRYNKDNLLNVVDRGIWTGSKTGFIESFKKSGDFAE